MTKDDTLKKLDQLMKRLIRHSGDNYQLTILKGKDRRAYKKDVEFVEHAIKLMQEDHIPDLFCLS